MESELEVKLKKAHGLTEISKVLESREDYLQITPDIIVSVPNMYNNFRFNLLGGRCRTVAIELGIMDALFESPHTALHSTKKLKQTYREFFHTIDETVKTLGIDFKRVEGLNTELAKKIKERAYEGMSSLHQQLCVEVLLLLYPALREKGYTHYDLVQ